eukprot:751518-Hanusia_phi.AAC.3
MASLSDTLSILTSASPLPHGSSMHLCAKGRRVAGNANPLSMRNGRGGLHGGEGKNRWAAGRRANAAAEMRPPAMKRVGREREFPSPGTKN